MDVNDDLDLTTQLASNSFPYFCRTVMQQTPGVPGGVIGKMHMEMIEDILGPDNNVFMAPRGHFKTTTISVYFPLWRMFSETKKQLTFLITSSSQQQSTEVLGHIKQHIELNPILNPVLYPEVVHDSKWSETQIRTKNRHRVISVPFGESARGFHCDYLMCDDVLRANSALNIEDAKAIFYGTVFPTTNAKRGKAIVVGTPVSYGDLLSELMKKSSFKGRKYACVKTDEAGNWLEPTFPEHFSLAQLARLRDTLPAHLWSRELMCEPMSENNALFPTRAINECVAMYPSVSQSYNKLNEDYLAKTALKDARDTRDITLPTTFISVDLAVSTSSDADYTVISRLETHPDHPAILREQVRRRMKPTDSFDTITSYIKRWNPKVAIVESNGVGTGVSGDLSDPGKSPDIWHLVRLYETRHHGREKMIGRLAVAVANHKLALPNDPELVKELNQMELVAGKNGTETYKSCGEHDDMVMSLALALEAAWAARPVSMELV